MTIAEIQRSIRAEIEPASEPLVDESVESTTVVDESVTVEGPTIVVAAPEAPPVEAHCEHCAEHAAQLAALDEKVTTLAMIEVAEEPEPVAEPEPEEPVQEETEPHREHFLNRRLGGGGE